MRFTHVLARRGYKFSAGTCNLLVSFGGLISGIGDLLFVCWLIGGGLSEGELLVGWASFFAGGKVDPVSEACGDEFFEGLLGEIGGGVVAAFDAV